ncbi:hypothetical protein [Nitratireductor sp. CH_MIT9313-5]|jgi:hypothetical protein
MSETWFPGDDLKECGTVNLLMLRGNAPDDVGKLDYIAVQQLSSHMQK